MLDSYTRLSARRGHVFHRTAFHTIWNVPFESDNLGKWRKTLTHGVKGTWSKNGWSETIEIDVYKSNKVFWALLVTRYYYDTHLWDFKNRTTAYYPPRKLIFTVKYYYKVQTCKKVERKAQYTCRSNWLDWIKVYLLKVSFSVSYYCNVKKIIKQRFDIMRYNVSITHNSGLIITCTYLYFWYNTIKKQRSQCLSPILLVFDCNF